MVVLRLLAVRADHGDGGLATERRVGQDHRPPAASVGRQGVSDGDEAVAVGLADAMQQQVHRCKTRSAVHQLGPADKGVSQVVLGRGVQMLSAPAGVVVGREKEPARAT